MIDIRFTNLSIHRNIHIFKRLQEGSKLALLPEIINDIDGKTPRRDDLTSCDGLNHQIPIAYKRSGFLSLSLKQLESNIFSKFKKSNIFTSCSDQDLSHDFCSKIEVEPTLKHVRLHSDKIGSFTPVSLLFNECSIAAISSWAAKEQDTAGEKLERNSIRYRPVPAPCFRKCNICKKWGHYDSECEEKDNVDILRLAMGLKQQQKSLIYASLNKLISKPANKLPLKPNWILMNKIQNCTSQSVNKISEQFTTDIAKGKLNSFTTHVCLV